MAPRTGETRTTTIRLPRAIYDQVKSVVDKESGGRSRASLNDVFVSAITAYLKMHNRRRIDAAFSGMAEDADYEKETKLLVEEFDHSDWEALKTGEEDLEQESIYAASSSR